MKLIFFIGVLLCAKSSWTAQRAKIASPNADIYSEANFDSDIIDSVVEGEKFLISNKVYGPFFRIKLKSGKIGYIPDTDVDIEGKGPVVPLTENPNDDPFLQDIGDPEAKTTGKSKKSNSPGQKDREKDREEEEEEDQVLRGVTLQLVNYHEDTLGAVQIDDLPALGYKSISDVTWEVMGSFKAPKYYSQQIHAAARAFNLWASFGITNDVPLARNLSGRYGGGPIGHVSLVNVETPQKNYDLQDVTAGIYLEGAFMLRIVKLRYDLSVKYIIEKQAYGAVGFTIFF